MTPTKISLKDFVLSGGGFNGDSYDCVSDPSLMLKLYFPGKIQQPLDEMLTARKVFDMGIPTPEPGGYVETEDGRYLFPRYGRPSGKRAAVCGRIRQDVPAAACHPCGYHPV